MGKREFEQYLKRQSSITEPPFDWDAQKEEWLILLAQFYKKVEKFLEKYVTSGDISFKYQDKIIDEDPIGSYAVSELHIWIKNKLVVLDPVGTNIIGAKGRVDMKGSAGIVKFVLVPRNSSAPTLRITIGNRPGPKKLKAKEGTESIDWDWKIATPPPRIKYIEVNGDSFFDSLMEVIDE
jgi:hypothetical protein